MVKLNFSGIYFIQSNVLLLFKMEIIIADIGQRSYTLEFSKKEFKIYRKSLFCSASTNSKVQKWAGGSGHHESHPLPKTPPNRNVPAGNTRRLGTRSRYQAERYQEKETVRRRYEATISVSFYLTTITTTTENPQLTPILSQLLPQPLHLL